MEKEKEMVRIFVGGLGDSVTADELRRVFELSGGAVESLEFVRSKARSFAYVDFSPSSDKSLSKLFAKYNGCVWKGGKLRLEKANEHYLKRLAREWDEEAAAKANDIRVAEVESSAILQNLTPPKKNDIRIFFPRLRKVRVLPFNGTGKHKYSFQRIDVSLPPKYFCDCEEHSGPSEKEKRACCVEPSGGGVNQDELDIMNKVMNTLFQKQSCEVIDNNAASLPDNTDNKVDDDDDDLVFNFVSKGGNEFASLETKQVRQVSQNQVKSGTPEQRPKRGRSQDPKQNDGEPQSKKKKPLSCEQNGGDEFKSSISEGKGDLYNNSDNKPSKPVEANKRVEPQTSNKWLTNAHVSWSQKSSWKELVGNKAGNRFSIASTEEGEPRSNPPIVAETESKKEDSERDISASTGKPEPISDSPNVAETESKKENPERDVSASTGKSGLGSDSPNVAEVESKKENSERDISAFTGKSELRSDSPNMVETESKKENPVRDISASTEKSEPRSEGNFEAAETKTEGIVEAQPAKSNVVSSQTRKGALWMQKSSWTQLVGDNGSFSISQPFPSTTLAPQVPENPKERNMLSSVDASPNEKENQDSDGGPSVPVTNEDVSMSSLKDEKQAVLGDGDGDCDGDGDECSKSMSEEKCDAVAMQMPSPVRVKVSETCTFMRSAASLKEWAKAKSACSKRVVTKKKT